MGKFVVIVLDGFGIGEMDDVKETRPQDKFKYMSSYIRKKRRCSYA